MNEVFFQVTCPSCETSFEVTDPSLIDQIVACPKCGGMILVAKPDIAAEAPVVEGESRHSELEENNGEERSDDVSYGQETSEVDKDASEVDVFDEDEEDKESVRTSKALAITCGIFCAILLTSIVSFVFFYLKSPTPNEGTQEVAATYIDPTTVDKTSSDENNEEITLNETKASEEGGEESTIPEDFDFQPVADEDEPSKTSGDVEPDASVGGDSEYVEEETGAAENEINPSNSETDFAEIADDQNGELLDVEPGSELSSDEESEDESLDDDGGLDTEFNEAEFAKANQSGAEETTDEEEDLGAVAMTVDVNAQAPLPTLSNPTRNVDVAARLKLPLNSIEFPESPAASMRLLSEFMGVPIEYDLDQFVLLRGSLNRKLDLKLEKVDVGTALAKLAEMLKWKVETQADRIVIGSLDAPGAVVEERFDVADLLALNAPIRVRPGDEAPYVQEPLTGEKLCDLINSCLEAPTGEDASSNESVRCDGKELVVRRDAVFRKRVETLLEQLRAVKRLTGSNAAPETIVPETLGWQTLEQKTNFNLLKSTSLQHALSILEIKFHFTILWDDVTLNTNGIGRDAKTLARIESESLDRVFFDLLEPLRLTYVILDEKLFLVTSQERANRYRTVEIHNFADAEASVSEKEIRKLTDGLQNAVASDSWNDPENALWLDLDSKCWIARQSQPIQREIRRWTKEHFRKNRDKSGGAQTPQNEDIPDGGGGDATRDESDFDKDASENAETQEEE